MAYSQKNNKIRKIIIISSCGILGLTLILCAAAYLLVHSYVKKINYVDINSEELVDEDLSGYDEMADDYLNDTEEVITDTSKETDKKEIQSAGSGGEGDAADMETMNQSSAEASAAAQNKVSEDSGTAENSSGNAKEEPEIIFTDEGLPLKEDKNVMNILLIGSDSRDMKKRGNSDAMIIISINKETKKIIATSLLRDSYVKISGKKDNRLNIAYIAGGARLLIKTIESNFKIKIDKYASVNFMAFIDIVDAVGGVTIEVTEKELIVTNRYIVEINGMRKEDSTADCLAEPGVLHLNGKQTLGFCRVRYVGTDFARTARQRKVLEMILDKVKSLNASQLNELLNKILPQVTTNFTEKELFKQIMALPDYLTYELESWSIPMKGAYKDAIIRNMEVLIIDFDKNIQELYRKVYNE